ncbi:hypothetical protein [Lactobacillus johnsonii]|uniref:Uncharacterized protein n=1 Tax=Lactobacillus johnsonii TaxID=33959 RepID=A0A9X0J7G7_LACJH|nr:hypothetical protein [Lactobacillus johnsonii]KXN76497.1 hypothetical protein AYJ53_03015 [Lactobacillus johnsonii]
MKKFKYPHFLMIFVDDIIATLLLILYLITVFRGHANVGIALLVIVFVSIMVFHINRLINYSAEERKKWQ